jgi:hypothetical protein
MSSKGEKTLEKEDKRQKLRHLKKRLTQLENVKLPSALKKLGKASEVGSDRWHQSAPFEIADEEVAVIRSMIIELKKEILKLQKEIYGAV